MVDIFERLIRLEFQMAEKNSDTTPEGASSRQHLIDETSFTDDDHDVTPSREERLPPSTTPPLHHAARQGSLDAVVNIVRESPQSVRERCSARDGGQTALTVAAGAGHAQVQEKIPR